MTEQTNLALREYTTSVGFNMMLSKRQIDLLVGLHFQKGRHNLFEWEYLPRGDTPEALMERYRRRMVFSHSITSMRALKTRGLLRAQAGEDWSLTKAGHLMVALLKEAGIYQERVKELGLDH